MAQLATKLSFTIENFYKNTQNVNFFDSLNTELVGLKDVKTSLKEFYSLLVVEQIRRIYGLSSFNVSLNMAFAGNSGTGKTLIASKFSLILRDLGLLSKGHLISVTREDLVGQYIGHTAPRTREQLQRALGGMLFIDDAPSLYKQNNERDYGPEVIELLLQVMENQRNNISIVFSGEKEKLSNFFLCNPGVASRIANHINFQNFNIIELCALVNLIAKTEMSYKIDEDALAIFLFYIRQFIHLKTFANAKTIKALFHIISDLYSQNLEMSLTKNRMLNFQQISTINEKIFANLTSHYLTGIFEADIPYIYDLT